MTEQERQLRNELMGSLNQARDMIYRLARHIRNPDQLDAIAWGVQGMDLLAEVQAMNPQRYAANVKRKARVK